MADTAGGGSIPVSELVAATVVRVAPGATLQEVADALVAGDIGAVVVGDGDVPEGIVSERDLVRAVAERRDLSTTRAVDIANTRLVWCDLTASIAEVGQEMADHYVRHVLVEEDGNLVGIVSARDVLGAYVASDASTEADAW